MGRRGAGCCVVVGRGRGRARVLFEPGLAVEAAVADGLADVGDLDVGGAVEVGDGAGHFQNTVVGAGGEVEGAHGGAEALGAGGVEGGVLLEEGGGHLGVAVDAGMGGEALLLDVAGAEDALADVGGGFAARGVGDGVEGHALDFYLDVYSVYENVVRIFYPTFSCFTTIRATPTAIYLGHYAINI